MNVVERTCFLFPPFSIFSSSGDDNDYDRFTLETPREMFHRPSIMFSLVCKLFKLTVCCLDFRSSSSRRGIR